MVSDPSEKAKPFPFAHLTVLGLGLIGGSIALGLKKVAPELQLTGIDLAQKIAGLAGGKVADRLVAAEDDEAVQLAMRSADLVVLAVPVRAIQQALPLALGSGATVTDCGSTKREILSHALELPGHERFVPGHPMAGAPEGGLGNARDDLFVGRRWVICPGAADLVHLERVRSLVALLGAQAVEIDAESHDRAVAVCSHLPQLMASALRVQGEAGDATRIAGPGFESMTRVAGGGEAMWRDIFESNPEAIATAVEQFIGRLEAATRGLRATPPDVKATLALLAEARSARRSG